MLKKPLMKMRSKNATADKPTVQAHLKGKDLLQAIEPVLLKGIPHYEDQSYARWLLGCLRRELEGVAPVKEPIPTSPFSDGISYWMAQPYQGGGAHVADMLLGQQVIAVPQDVNPEDDLEQFDDEDNGF